MDLDPLVTVLGPDPVVAAERDRVRAFLDRADFTPMVDGWMAGFSPAFSRALGAEGWIGSTWPSRYGGRELPNRVRHAVIEELLAAGAPVAAHWFADRQIGPSLLRHGTQEQRRRFLPAIARGELYFSVGLSEPDSGSDLASVRTRATRQDSGGWLVDGAKVWTSHAHEAHHVLALVRTSPPDPERRHAGLSQLIVDLRAPGVTVRPIRSLDGAHHFNEVVFDDVRVPDGDVLGVVGNGWPQVIEELSYERSGPERFLSTFPLLSTVDGPALGHLYSRVWALRQLSTGVAAALDDARAAGPPSLDAALVKDLGTGVELDVIDAVRRTGRPHPLLAQAQLASPGFSLRGGTTEIMRGIIAAGLGL